MPWIGGGSDAGKKIELKSGYALPHDENVGAVIVGFDREINYHKIQCAPSRCSFFFSRRRRRSRVQQ